MNASLLWPLAGATALLAAGCHGAALTPPDGGGSATGSATTAGTGGVGGAIFPAAGSGGSAPDGGCALDAGADGADASTGCEGLEAGVSYPADVAPIFVQSCNGELCHLTPTPTSLVSVPTHQCCDARLLVAPGDAAHSYLIDKLTDHNVCSGGGMPLGKPALADADILTIRRWICEGAPAD
jgi:hypothetical protein